MQVNYVNTLVITVQVQPWMYTVTPYYTKPICRSMTALTTDWYPEYVHFQNLIISYLFPKFHENSPTTWVKTLPQQHVMDVIILFFIHLSYAYSHLYFMIVHDHNIKL